MESLFYVCHVQTHSPQANYCKKDPVMVYSGVKILVSEARPVIRKAKSSNLNSAWLSFRKARNKTVCALRTAKKNFLRNLSLLVHTPRQFGLLTILSNQTANEFLPI